MAYWINYACGQHREKLGNWDWRMVVIFQILIPTMVVILIPFCPETPRWYIRKNNNVEAARTCLLRLRETPEEAEERKVREKLASDDQADADESNAFLNEHPEFQHPEEIALLQTIEASDEAENNIKQMRAALDEFSSRKMIEAADCYF